jgi:hypothetical protein|tara:strand:+ start:404 stop:547 length:144 start_codon:yes stop_codon:yes gene_type:complete
MIVEPDTIEDYEVEKLLDIKIGEAAHLMTSERLILRLFLPSKTLMWV